MSVGGGARFREMMVLRTCLILLLASLGACSLAPEMEHNATDYFEVTDLATNRIILLNVLRAKDGAPLHFSELSNIRGVMTAGVTLGASWPFGPLEHSTNFRHTGSITLSGSTNPSFDVGSLDTQDFTKGVMTTISPDTVKFFLDSGIDHRLVLILLASGVRLPGNDETMLNAPNSARRVCYDKVLTTNEAPTRYRILAADEPKEACHGTEELEFYGFLRVINGLSRVYAVTLREPTPVGEPFALDLSRQLRETAALDPTKYQLRQVGPGRFQLMQVARGDTVVLCREPDQGGRPTILTVLSGSGGQAPPVPEAACIPGRSIAQSDARPAPPASLMPAAAHTRTAGRQAIPLPLPVAADPRVTPGISGGTAIMPLRATFGVIQFLGDILSFQETETAATAIPRCITLNYLDRTKDTCTGKAQLLFRLEHEGPGSGIDVDYARQNWVVPARGVCQPDKSCDHTLQAMAMVSLLLNMNKSAKDIPFTPAVQAVP